METRRTSLILPILLIGFGVVLLLNNLGVIQWDIWQSVFRLWPILLIAAGLDLVIGRRSVGATVVLLVLILGLAFAGVWLLSVSPGGAFRTEEVRQPSQGARQAEVEIRGSVGRLDISALESDETLVSGSVGLGPGERLDQEFRLEDGVAYFSLGSEGEWMIPDPRSWSGDHRWDLRVSASIPLRLEVHGGVGESDLDLRDLAITRLDVESGVGRTTLVLPDRGRYDARVQTGVGEVEIVLPAGLASRITVSSGIGAVEVIGAFRLEDGAYTSPDFEQAEDRVQLDVTGGIGRIVIRSSP